LFPATGVGARRADALALHHQKVRGRDDTQVGILRDLLCPSAGTIREISFRQCLQPPGDAPEQMLAVP
jgi:hypothetical protein